MMLPNPFWKRALQTAPAPGEPTTDADGAEPDSIATGESSEGDAAITASAPLIATSTTLRDRLTITWSVPEERLRPHLPDSILPDRLPAADGALRGFVQVEYALHESPKLSRLPKLLGSIAPSFHQVTYRILTRRTKDGKSIPGSFEMRTFVSASETHIARRAVQHQADFARFTVFVDGDPARGTYRLIRIRAGGDLGVTQLEVRAGGEPGAVPAPFASYDDLTRFLAQRDEVLYRASLPKNRIGSVPLVKADATDESKRPPVHLGALVSARCTPWMDLRILRAEELSSPLHVTIEAEATVQALVPRLAKTVTEA